MIFSMIIPWQSIPDQTLRNLIEHFVLREGTDYGEQEVSFEDKVEQVYLKLKLKEATLVYSELHESIDIKINQT